MSEEMQKEFGGQEDTETLIEQAKPDDVILESQEIPVEPVVLTPAELLEMDVIEMRYSQDRMAVTEQELSDKMEGMEIELGDSVDDQPDDGRRENSPLDKSDYATYEVPDGNSPFTSVDPHIKTLEENPAEDAHANEWGMRNAISVVEGTGVAVSSYGFPILTKDANGSGDTTWKIPDADGSGTQKSLEIIDSFLQDYGFQADGFATSTPAAADTVYMRDADGPTKIYVTKADFADYIQDALQITVSQITDYVTPVTDHGALTGLSDDDHPIYLTVDGAYTRNTVASLGNTSDILIFDVNNQIIYNSASGRAMEWDIAGLEVYGGTLIKSDSIEQITAITAKSENSDFLFYPNDSYTSRLKIGDVGGAAEWVGIDIASAIDIKITSTDDMWLSCSDDNSKDLLLGVSGTEWKDIYLYLDGNLTINGSAGLSVTDNFYNDGTSGNTTQMVHTKGILTARTQAP